jgi:hypothetical protein
MSSEVPTRDEALRRVLVATVDSTRAPERRRWDPAVASVGAFALAGALTGGTLATVNAPQADTIRYDAPLEISRPSIIDDDAVILGTPLTVTGRESTVIDLGVAPDAATGLVVEVYCLEPGFYRVKLDGHPFTEVACTAESERPEVVMSAVQVIDGAPPRAILIERDSGGYLVWAAWIDQPADAAPSSLQQEALADGVVTREEYEAGFDRYVACMAELGFHVNVIDAGTETIWYSIPGDAGNSGAANRCYEAEFDLVDMAWQGEHPR